MKMWQSRDLGLDPGLNSPEQTFGRHFSCIVQLDPCVCHGISQMCWTQYESQMHHICHIICSLYCCVYLRRKVDRDMKVIEVDSVVSEIVSSLR